jgi:transcriptional regulator with XRE-family HTH domain
MIEGSTPPVPSETEPASGAPGGRTFGEWLRVQLKARRISQRQLAQKSGVDHSTISRLVRGDRVPSWSTADRLVRSLGFADVPDGVYRLDSGRTASPTARVEYALRLDETLSETQVREIMNVYLATRRRRPRLVVSSPAPAASTPSARKLGRISELPRRPVPGGGRPGVPGDRSS